MDTNEIYNFDSLYRLFSSQKDYAGKVFEVYSGLADREKQFQSFSDSKDGILINVNIMNEGVIYRIYKLFS